MKLHAEVAKWQTQLTQNQPGLKSRVGSSPTFGITFTDFVPVIFGVPISKNVTLV